MEMIKDEEGPNNSVFEQTDISSFSSIDFLVLFVSKLTSMNVFRFDYQKLKKYLYECKEKNLYQNILNNIDIDNNYNSIDLDNAYNVLNICRVLAFDKNYIYINGSELNVFDVFNEYEEIVTSIDDFVVKYFDANKEERLFYGYFDLDKFNNCFLKKEKVKKRFLRRINIAR